MTDLAIVTVAVNGHRGQIGLNVIVHVVEGRRIDVVVVTQVGVSTL